MIHEPLSSTLPTQSQKSSLSFPKGLRGLPLCLAFSGFTPIPLTFKAGKLIPFIPWKDLSLPEDPLERVDKAQKLFLKGDTVGVAIKAGETSGLVVLDIDDPEKFEAFYPLEKLIEEASYVVKTKDEGHWHIGFSWEPEFPESRSFLKEAGFEIKSNGSLVNFYTVLPEAQYKPIKLEPLRPMPQELKERLLALLKNSENPAQKGTPEPQKTNIDPQEVIELASEIYLRGQRQYWTIYTAGFLRKLGFSLEEAKEALEVFLRAQGDEELKMRLAGIEHTYQEPLDNVKGLSGLLELGLNEETYLKLHRAKIQKEKAQAPKYFTLKDILTLEVKEPSWIIPNLLPEGFTILGGKPKVGKSWLALQIALTCVQLGKRVVYFALEDTKGRLQKRLKVLGITDLEALNDLPLLFSFELSKIREGVIKELRACIQEFKPNLIIIDPWAKIKPQTKGKDLYLEEYQALDTFREFLKDGVNILLVHHARKSPSEDPLDEILGSTGQTAVVDNILVLKRGRGSQTAVLHSIFRDFEEVDLGLRFENGWKIEGKAEEVMLGEGQKEVLEAIKKLEEMGEKATIKAIAELTGKSSGVIRFLLYKLIQKGLIERSQKGTYSLCKSIKSANNANNANNANMLTMLTNQPQPSFVSDVSGIANKVLTFLDKENQGFGEFVSNVSNVSNVVNCYPIPTPDPTPEPKEAGEHLPFGGSSEPKGGGEEEVFFLLMPENEKCPRCGSEVWKVKRRIYEAGMGGGSCARCGHISWFGNFGKGQVLEGEAEVEFLLMDFSRVDGNGERIGE